MKRALLCVMAAAVCHSVDGARDFASSSALRSTNAARKPNGIMKEMNFEHRLLLCNAYPATFGTSVTQNSRAVVDDKDPLGFRECRYVEGVRLKQQDKLTFKLADSGISGTFEVGTLPSTDAVLLLVLEKRDPSSALASFQSFAFPKSSGQTAKDAQVAIIDAYRGNSTHPLLRMEDHIEEKEKNTISKRVELLNFNRVYAVEEGVYDASMSDSLDQAGLLEQSSVRVLNMKRSENYIVLRTGGGKFDQELTIFPQLKSGAAQVSSVLGFAMATLSALLSH